MNEADEAADQISDSTDPDADFDNTPVEKKHEKTDA
jgi:hypothetical protein